MTLAQIESYVQQGISVLSNPSQSSVAAAGAAGVFSAEFNNLRQAAQQNLSKFQAKIPAPLQGLAASFFSPFKNALAGSPSNPIPQNPSGTIFGLTYLQAILIGAGAIVVFLLVRKK